MKSLGSLKSEITTSPFATELEYQSGHESYWSYKHMVLQIEDCVDILHQSHPQFDIIFLLDHSSGYDCTRPDGLNINKLNIRYGGRQPSMRSSSLSISEFGPFHSNNATLQPGHSQSMLFKATEVGPCYLSQKERDDQRLDRITSKRRKKDFTKSLLIEQLKANGTIDPKGTRKTLNGQCT